MAKLVILNQGLSGQTYDLKVGRTTIGRVDDNSFEISDPSVSSHHAEIHWRGPEATDALFRDLGSTNGSFINGERITEAVLKLGQSLRLGYVELSFLDDSAPIPAPVASAPAPAPSPSAPPPLGAPAPAAKPASPAPVQEPAKKTADGTLVIPRGVSLTDLEQGGTRGGGFNNNTTVFSKKKRNPNKIFIVGGIVVGVIILILIIVAFIFATGSSHQ